MEPCTARGNGPQAAGEDNARVPSVNLRPGLSAHPRVCVRMTNERRQTAISPVHRRGRLNLARCVPARDFDGTAR
ncbi:MAG: hypothetical protein KGO50_00125 [Myxococcales bacterium]|nr:hypothetical protein [Myxococcales bacterium]